MTEHEEVAIRQSPIGWVLILLQLGLGFMTIALAVDEGFARGKAVFAGDNWRIVLGALGAFLFYRAARGFVRTINQTPVELSPQTRRSSRINGIAVQLVGAAFWLAASNGEVAAHSVAFEGWVQPVYLVSGIFLVFFGTIYWMDPAKVVQARRALKARQEAQRQEGPFG